MNPDLAEAMLGRGKGKFFDTSRAGSTMSEAHVYMVGGGVPAVGGAPLGGNISGPHMLGERPKLVNKRQGGWRAFAEKWRQRYELILCHNRGVVPADCYLLEDLKQCLDEEDQKQMDYQRRGNHGLTCREFLEFLQQEYDKDALEQTRSAWQRVQLPQGELTVDRWAMFMVDFKLARDAVDGWTPEEEYRMIISRLPAKWANEVITWEGEQKRVTYMVRIPNVPGRSLPGK